jgi:hypothetical protein
MQLSARVLKNFLLVGLIGACVFLGGCGNAVNYDLTEDAVAISDSNDHTYFNPNDAEDRYHYVEIDGVKYIPYGTQGKRMTNREVGACIAYSAADSNDRFYEVIGSSDFVARYDVGGVMEQFDFWRSVDTIGKEIDVPDFIDPLGYDIWNENHG